MHYTYVFKHFHHQEALKRTKMTLKLLESKRVAVVAVTAKASAAPNHRVGAQRLSSSCTRKSNLVVDRPKFAATDGVSSYTDGLVRVPTAIVSGAGCKPEGKAPPAIFKGNSTNDGMNNCQPSTLLQRLTEQYSDRVSEYGGGKLSSSTRKLSMKTDGSGGGGGSAADRKRLHAAAVIVQQAFRVRMFRRFTWAQAFLRRPLHVFRLFARVSRPLHSPARPSLARSSEPAMRARVAHTSDGNVSAVGDCDPITSINSWAEPRWFCLSDPHHVHSADEAFWACSRWHRDHCRDASAAPSNQQSLGGRSHVFMAHSRTPYEETSPNVVRIEGSCGDGEQDILGTTPAASCTEPRAQSRRPDVGAPVMLAASGRTTPEKTQTEPPPEGADVFLRKYAVRKEAVRVLMLELRLPLPPGALEHAIEDLEKDISGENASWRGVGNNISTMGDQSTAGREAGTSGETTSQQTCFVRTKKNAGFAHGRGISFASFYQWWVRHLPHYDLASTSCVMKTVQCARALHSTEVSSGRL